MAKELSLMGQLRKEADRDFSKYLKYVNEIFEENKSLIEENKNLNEEIQRFKDNAMQDMREITELEIENKKLKEKLSEVTMVADDEKQSVEHILELEEENKKLKEMLTYVTDKEHTPYIDKGMGWRRARKI